MKKELELFLPTSKALFEMTKDEFTDWVHRASIEISEREERRDPLNQLRIKVSSIIDNNFLTERQKEYEILHEISKYKHLNLND